jgi:TRAP-type C4-dicarboxylate transport system permease small subunit
VFQTSVARLSRLLLAAAALLIFLLGFIIVTDVIGRGAFNRPLQGTPEIVAMSIVVICFLLAGYAVQSGSMIYADVFVSIFGARGRAFSQLLSAVLGLLFFGLIVWGSYEPALHAWRSGEYEGEGALRIAVWPARLVVVLGAVLVVAAYIVVAIDAVRVLVTGRSDEPAASTSLHI